MNRILAGCAFIAILAGGCGTAEREGDESERAYAERLFSDCSEEHASDLSSDEEIYGCWDDALAEAVDNGDLPSIATQIGSKGTQLSDLAE
jgi:hypothetical protein